MKVEQRHWRLSELIEQLQEIQKDYVTDIPVYVKTKVGSMYNLYDFGLVVTSPRDQPAHLEIFP